MHVLVGKHRQCTRNFSALRGIFFNCRLPDEVRVRWELVMTSKVQTADDRLHQLADDAADLVRKFAELAMLRELVEETESALGIKRASH